MPRRVEFANTLGGFAETEQALLSLVLRATLSHESGNGGLIHADHGQMRYLPATGPKAGGLSPCASSFLAPRFPADEAPELGLIPGDLPFLSEFGANRLR